VAAAGEHRRPEVPMRRFVAASIVVLLVGGVGCGDDTGGGGSGGSGSGGGSSTGADATSTTDASSTSDASSTATGDAGSCTLDPATDPECAEIVSGGVTLETGYICTGDAEPDCDAFSIGDDRYCCPPE
jgi:hypothetical protein